MTSPRFLVGIIPLRLGLRLVVALAALYAAPAAAQSKATIKMGDNLPDRNNTWGAIVEQINREFKAAHPEAEIVTESYPDQPYQQKIKIYATARQLPDVFKFWSFTSLLKPLIDGGFVAPLDRAAFEGLGYRPARSTATPIAASSTASRCRPTSGSSITTSSCSRTPA